MWIQRILLVLLLGLLGSSFSQSDNRWVQVAPTGNDVSGDDSSPKPFASLAKAASVAKAGQTIRLAAGTYTETKPAVLGLGVSLEGADEDKTSLVSNGVELVLGVDPKNKDFKLWYDGNLTQLISAPYPPPKPRYGEPKQMLPAQDGNQTLSGFGIEGNKQLTVGIWVENRNNVTLRNITFKNLKERGAVVAKGDMWWYEPLCEGLWMKGAKIHDLIDLTFVNSATDLPEESLGNLNLAGLDGAEVYIIRINENLGYGVKFIFVGHFRNLRLHDCFIRVPERDDKWGEDASIELWNLDQNNKVYNIDTDT